MKNILIKTPYSCFFIILAVSLFVAACTTDSTPDPAEPVSGEQPARPRRTVGERESPPNLTEMSPVMKNIMERIDGHSLKVGDIPGLVQSLKEAVKTQSTAEELLAADYKNRDFIHLILKLPKEMLLPELISQVDAILALVPAKSAEIAVTKTLASSNPPLTQTLEAGASYDDLSEIFIKYGAKATHGLSPKIEKYIEFLARRAKPAESYMALFLELKILNNLGSFIVGTNDVSFKSLYEKLTPSEQKMMRTILLNNGNTKAIEEARREKISDYHVLGRPTAFHHFQVIKLIEILENTQKWGFSINDKVTARTGDVDVLTYHLLSVDTAVPPFAGAEIARAKELPDYVAQALKIKVQADGIDWNTFSQPAYDYMTITNRVPPATATRVLHR